MRVKVCGIRRESDAQSAVELGAWAIGMIFWPSSPRAVDPQVAAAIAAAQRRNVELVGVFVNPSLEELSQAAENFHLSYLQLHGDEGPAFCAEAARRTGAKIIKALRITDASDVRDSRRFHTDAHLFDSAARGLRGGSGESWEWTLARGRDRRVPLILSGGLNAENVHDAIASVEPFAVDVNSGVESAPGIKDPAKLARFMAELSDPVAA